MKQPRPGSDILICLPTYNERDNVCRLVSRIRALPLAADILFVDDHSPDGTGAVLDDLADKAEGLHVLHRPCRQGVGSAHKEAIRFGYQHGYRILITMDADGTHSPEDIPRLVEKATVGVVVIGSRFLSAAADYRSRKAAFQSRLVHRLTSGLLKLPGDVSNAFRLYRLDKIDPTLFAQCRSNSYAFFPESLYRLDQKGMIIKEVPVCLSRRQTGKSKARLRDIAEWLIQVICLRMRNKRSTS